MRLDIGRVTMVHEGLAGSSNGAASVLEAVETELILHRIVKHNVGFDG